MKELRFTFRGEIYRVDKNGKINANGLNYFSNNWKFLGGTHHHWSKKITVSLQQAFKNPEKLNGCLGFDVDHGTTRQWGGKYNGKLPRITNTHVIEI